MEGAASGDEYFVGSWYEGWDWDADPGEPRHGHDRGHRVGMMSLSSSSASWGKFVTAEGTCEIGEIRWMRWGWGVDGRVAVGCNSAESLPDEVVASP